MNRLTENKIIIVKRKTRLDELIVRFNTIMQAKFYVEHLGSDFEDYVKEDQQYKNSIVEACDILSSLGRIQVIDREFLPNFIFGESDLVIAIGQDGLVANTIKYLDSQLLIGVNPDPKRWDGVLLPFKVPDLKLIVKDAFSEKVDIKEITMAKATLNDGQILYGVNDIFIGQKTHVSSRYFIEYDGIREQQSSSGVIVSTGLGSTGWLRSILAGAAGITSNSANKKAKIKEERKFSWDSKYLYFSVREPFPSKVTKTEIVFGKVDSNNPLKINSLMPENGVIFSDGLENDFLQFNSGIEAVISIADKKGHLAT